MTFTERRELQRKRNAKITARQYRCRYCRVVVDGPSRAGHLGRCERFSVELPCGSPVDGHFDEVVRP